MLMKFQDPSLHSLIIGFSTYMFDWHRVIKGNWIPRLVSPYSKCKSVDKGCLQYFRTAVLTHQRNNEIKQNISTFRTRHVFLIFSLSSIVLDVIRNSQLKKSCSLMYQFIKVDSSACWQKELLFNKRGYIKENKNILPLILNHEKHDTNRDRELRNLEWVAIRYKIDIELGMDRYFTH